MRLSLFCLLSTSLVLNRPRSSARSEEERSMGPFKDELTELWFNRLRGLDVALLGDSARMRR